MNKAVVILSGGLDSVTNLYVAQKKMNVALAITFNYGQRAFNKELQSAAWFCGELKITHKVVDISWIRDFGGSSLTDLSKSIPLNEVKIDDHSRSMETAKSVWVPNRNGIFLNIAAGFAESLGAGYIIPGFNYEEATTFPDNSEEFMLAITKSLEFSTANKVKVLCYTSKFDKTEIVKLALEHGVVLNKLWSCYQDKDSWCGECESCKRLKRALLNHGLDFDKLSYIGL